MCRPYSCESRDFISGSYCHTYYEYNENYLEAIEKGYLKRENLVWVELMIPEFGKVAGVVIRSKWKNIKRRNLDYEFNGNIYYIRDIIHFVEYYPSKLLEMTHNQKASYSITLNFEMYIPKKYGHWRPYFENIPKHVLLHGGLCYWCYSIIHEVFQCDFCRLSLCTECLDRRDMSIRQCEECGLYRCVRYSLEAGQCVYTGRAQCGNCGY